MFAQPNLALDSWKLLDLCKYNFLSTILIIVILFILTVNGYSRHMIRMIFLMKNGKFVGMNKTDIYMECSIVNYFSLKVLYNVCYLFGYFDDIYYIR